MAVVALTIVRAESGTVTTLCTVLVTIDTAACEPDGSDCGASGTTTVTGYVGVLELLDAGRMPI